MPYVTLPVSPVFRQVTIEDILDGYVDLKKFEPVRNRFTSTRTTYRKELKPEFIERYDITGMVLALKSFNDRHEELFKAPRASLYTHYEIPKREIDPRTGRPKTRPIDAPNDELKAAFYELKDIFENKCGVLYHTNAFAYIPNRCAVDAVRIHQKNSSHWFLKTDFTNFFGSTTEKFVQDQLHMIFPFSEMYKYPAGKEALEKALSLCFLRGGLPQGTPVSPMLTNLMMIPIDHRFANTLRDFYGVHFVYTRYADDILLSSKIKFNSDIMVAYFNNVLTEFHAPFSINAKKTRFGSGNGHNYNLGVCLNEHNDITVGFKQKRVMRSMMYNYIKDRASGNKWDVHEIQTMQGLLSYYHSVEPQYWDTAVKKYNDAYHIDLKEAMKADLS